MKWNIYLGALEQKILSDFFNWLNIDSRNLQVYICEIYYNYKN